MATVVPCASCYARSSFQPLQLFGRGPRGAYYRSLIAHRGPRSTPRPRLACHTPKMTLRQICHMLRMMKQVRKREAAAAAAASRKQGSAAPPPASPSTKTEKKSFPCCFRRRCSIKHFG
ncbi:hypothetical protein LDENG_00219840 [Lucifuga dentata]|nr:hypothetical protein LDENG_00219840 [Lucifuga dentata]